MTLALEKDSIRRCYGLSRLYLYFVVVIALDVSLRRPELCVGRVVMEVRALRWTCVYGGQSIALDVWLWRSEELISNPLFVLFFPRLP